MNKKINKLSSKVGIKIKLELIKRGWSQEKLAERSNLINVSTKSLKLVISAKLGNKL